LSLLVVVVVCLVCHLLLSVVLRCPWTFIEDHDSSSTPLSSADDNPTHCKLSSSYFLLHPLIILVETPPPYKGNQQCWVSPTCLRCLLLLPTHRPCCCFSSLGTTSKSSEVSCHIHQISAICPNSVFTVHPTYVRAGNSVVGETSQET